MFSMHVQIFSTLKLSKDATGVLSTLMLKLLKPEWLFDMFYA